MPPDFETQISDARHRKKGRESLATNNISTFAADGTPLPIIDTSEKTMKKNKNWIAALLAFNSQEVKEEKD